MRLDRRRFLQAAGAGTGLVLGAPPLTSTGTHGARRVVAAADDAAVRLSGDGLALTPAQYTRLMARLIDEKGVVPDSYRLAASSKSWKNTVRVRSAKNARYSCPPARWPITWPCARSQADQPRDRSGTESPVSGRR